MIRSISLGHLKSFSIPQKMKFKTPNGQVGSGYNVIVGENNSGKTTFINAVRLLLSREQSVTVGQEARHEPDKPLIEIVWEDSNGTLIFGIDINTDGAIFQKIGDRSRTENRFRFVPSRRPFASEYNTHVLSPRDYEENEHSNRLSNQSYFDTQLATSIATFFAQHERKAAFLANLKAADPRSAEFSTDNVGGKNVLLYQGPSKRKHIISDTGDGITNLIRIIYTLVTSEHGDTIVIDEPELSLHPQLQRNLYKILIKFSNERQIIVVTHSPHFIGWREISTVSGLFRVYIDKLGRSIVASPPSAAFDAVKAHANVMSRKHYDVLCKELFFADRVLLVEGSDDVHYIENFLENEELLPLPMMGYGCGGANAITPWMRLCFHLGIKCASIFDGDKKELFEISQKEFSNNSEVSSWLLFRDDIRDKHQRNASGSETNTVLKNGIFWRDGKIHEECRDEFAGLLGQIQSFLDS